MSRPKKSSPEILRELWSGYCARFRVSQPSKQQVSKNMGLDPHALSKWMQLDAKGSRRIPVERIAQVATGLMLSSEESRRLMTARIAELAADDPSVKVAVLWVADSAKQQAARRHALTQDEAFVLEAYRLAEQNFPRGLVCGVETQTALVAMMQVLLEADEASYIAEESLVGDRAPVDHGTWRAKFTARLAEQRRLRPSPALAAQAAAKEMGTAFKKQAKSTKAKVS